METPDYRVIILGAGESTRGGLPAALVAVGNRGRLLDWLLTAFDHLPDPDVNFVSGFMAQEVMRHYREIRFHHNPDWRETGPAKSLSLAPLSSKVATFICYSDVVFREESIRRLWEVDAELVVAIDRAWKVRYDGRSESELVAAEKVILDDQRLVEIGQDVDVSSADAEFCGIIKLSSSTAKRLENVLTSSTFRSTDSLPNVLSFLLRHKVVANTVDVDGEWAELNAPQDLAHFVLGTKAESLERLRPLLTSGSIGELLRLTLGQWQSDRAGLLQKIHDTFDDTCVIVRSSSLLEDGWSASAAGAFTSIPDVPTDDPGRLAEVVDEVFASYGDVRLENQVLIQEMLTKVRMSGVVMTRTHEHGAPYYVVNYDDISGGTDSVTSGEGRHVKTLFVHRSSVLGDSFSSDLHAVMETVRELEQVVGHDSLDIEFAVDAEGVSHILQVRPIVTTQENYITSDEAVQDGIRDAKRFFRELQRPSPFLLGESTQLSVMSDWNPAEIVGTKPGILALSLYRYIITDETWARQRVEWGYRDVRPCNLLVEIESHPYVDVRATFNSFVPAAIEDDLARRLLEHHLAKLAARPELHDKVEFDVLLTCWSFDIDERLEALGREAGFSREELGQIREGLHDITQRGIQRCRNDYDALAATARRFDRIAATDLSHLERAFLHLENAREYGALHFSHLARAGFVAVILLRSLVSRGVISSDEQEAFLASLETVSGTMQEDAARVARGGLDWQEFIDRYGHLRPGTYDINSAHYASAPEEFLRPVVEQVGSQAAGSPPAFTWSAETTARVQEALEDADLGVDFAGFEEFLRLGIEGREHGKFVFTRDLSAALEHIAEFGSEHFISRKKMSRIRIGDILRMRRASSQDISSSLLELAQQGKRASRVQQAICLPGQIFEPEDIACFEYRETAPNFVTRKKVRCEIVVLGQDSSPNTNLENKIVVISNADPGFDWIFARGIAGLITMYGGANSHMAIRMAEFELPGVTGVGELLFEQLCRAHVAELDCAGRQVRIVR